MAVVRIIVGDGSRSGGIPHSSFEDVQNNRLISGTSSGTNTITFRVNNSGGGPTGLLINSLSGTVAVPEVGTILPIFGALAIYGLVVARRRSSRQTATA